MSLSPWTSGLLKLCIRGQPVRWLRRSRPCLCQAISRRTYTTGHKGPDADNTANPTRDEGGDRHPGATPPGVGATPPPGAGADKATSFDIDDDFSTFDQEEFERQKREQLKEEDEEATWAIKQKILGAAMQFVPEHGWTKMAIELGASEAGMPALAHGLFPRGGAELVLYFYQTSNAKLAQQMAAEVEQVEAGEVEPKRISTFIRDAVETRLRMTAPYISTWPQAMGLLALPQNAPDALHCLQTLVDDIWCYAGDKSTDFNWYTKRASLAALYKSTELYMLQDKSEDLNDTLTFLDRRMQNLADFNKLSKQLQDSNGVIGDLMWGGWNVARNVLGVNDSKR